MCNIVKSQSIAVSAYILSILEAVSLTERSKALAFVWLSSLVAHFRGSRFVGCDMAKTYGSLWIAWLTDLPIIPYPNVLEITLSLSPLSFSVGPIHL